MKIVDTTEQNQIEEAMPPEVTLERRRGGINTIYHLYLPPRWMISFCWRSVPMYSRFELYGFGSAAIGFALRIGRLCVGSCVKVHPEGGR